MWMLANYFPLCICENSGFLSIQKSGEQKARHFRAGLFYQLRDRLRSLDVGSLLALRALCDFKGDLLAFFE